MLALRNLEADPAADALLRTEGVVWSAGDFAARGSSETLTPLLSLSVKNAGIASVPFGVWALVQMETSRFSTEFFEVAA